MVLMLISSSDGEIIYSHIDWLLGRSYWVNESVVFPKTHWIWLTSKTASQYILTDDPHQDHGQLLNSPAPSGHFRCRNWVVKRRLAIRVYMQKSRATSILPIQLGFWHSSNFSPWEPEGSLRTEDGGLPTSISRSNSLGRQVVWSKHLHPMDSGRKYSSLFNFVTRSIRLRLWSS